MQTNNPDKETVKEWCDEEWDVFTEKYSEFRGKWIWTNKCDIPIKNAQNSAKSFKWKLFNLCI